MSSSTPATPASAPAPIAASADPSFTKIDNQGNALPDDAPDAYAIRVIHGALAFDMRCGDVSDAAGRFEMNDADAIKAVAALGDRWRVPSLPELEAIRDITRWNPAVDPQFFPDVKPDWYRTSSPWPPSPAVNAWFVSFDYGASDGLDRSYYARVRAVRSLSVAGQ